MKNLNKNYNKYFINILNIFIIINIQLKKSLILYLKINN